MDSNMSKIYCPEIKLNTLDNLKSYTPKYHKDTDVFYLKSASYEPATSYDLDGLIWLRINIDTGDIVGIQIDDFESVFLKKYPKLAKAWKEAKSLHVRKVTQCEYNSRESFLIMIIDFLKYLFVDHPQQMKAEIVPAGH